MHRLVALALVLAAPAALACPAQAWSTAPATPNNAVLADDGGVLMAMESDRSGGYGRGGYSLRAGGKAIAATEVYLAAGMSMLVPASPGARALELVDATGKVVRTFTREAAGAKLAPPAAKVKSTLTPAALKKWGTSGPSYGIPSAQMTVTLAADPPADVVGLVVYDAQTKQGLAFGLPQGRQIVFYQGGKGCGGPSNAAAQAGKRVTLGWVDKHGRISAPSAPITVSVAP